MVLVAVAPPPSLASASLTPPVVGSATKFPRQATPWSSSLRAPADNRHAPRPFGAAQLIYRRRTWGRPIDRPSASSTQRRSLLAFHDPTKRCPPATWATRLVVFSLFLATPRASLLIASAGKLAGNRGRGLPPAWLPLLAGAAGFGEDWQVAGGLLLCLLLGRQVEEALGGRAMMATLALVVASCLAAGSLASPGSLAQAVSPATQTFGLIPAAFLMNLLWLMAATSKAFKVESVTPDKPLPGCATVAFWFNRWRLLKLVILGQFVAMMTQVSRQATLGMFLFSSSLAPLVFLGIRSVARRKKKEVDVKKMGDEMIDAGDKFLQEQEGKLDLALKAAEIVTDFTDTTAPAAGKDEKEKAGKDVDKKELLGMARRGLDVFKGFRQQAKDTLSQKLVEFASEEDENPRVAATQLVMLISIIASLAACRLIAFLGVPAGGYLYRATAGSSAPFQVASQMVASVFVHGGWTPSLSGAALLLMAAGRAVEMRKEVGSAGLIVAYLAGGIGVQVTALVLGAQPGVQGLGAIGAVAAVVLLAVFHSLAPQRLRPGAALRTLVSPRALLQVVVNVDWNRLLEAVLFLLFTATWALRCLPASLPGVLLPGSLFSGVRQAPAVAAGPVLALGTSASALVTLAALLPALRICKALIAKASAAMPQKKPPKVTKQGE
eukprot:TRINITY_DN33269_c0_g1_i4.p1 TRINITY_DN33269_c0_g1~~TRINITY_DN33269_c0_g1_i4.p1  ORF type:complete len:665 (+),score=133.97 TRINITY_DN33269_c0_g1_i4:89-2083(+)